MLPNEDIFDFYLNKFPFGVSPLGVGKLKYGEYALGDKKFIFN